MEVDLLVKWIVETHGTQLFQPVDGLASSGHKMEEDHQNIWNIDSSYCCNAHF